MNYPDVAITKPSNLLPEDMKQPCRLINLPGQWRRQLKE